MLNLCFLSIPFLSYGHLYVTTLIPERVLEDLPTRGRHTFAVAVQTKPYRQPFRTNNTLPCNPLFMVILCHL